MLWIRRLFWIAGIYGLVVMAPQYFMEQKFGADFPPATDPVRYRLLMIPAAIEKFSFAVAVAVLFAQARVPTIIGVFAAIDLVLGGLFLLAFARLGKTAD